MEDGIRKAYQMAETELQAGRAVKIVVLSDGVGNIGRTDPAQILDQIGEQSRRGAALHTIGIGFWHNYNDVMMEALSNWGNGTYSYITTREELQNFQQNAAQGMLRETVRDARVQVEFNENAVEQYRLIGYENRAVADEDFRDDSLDFGEPAFNRDITALYEVKLNPDAAGSDLVATATVRWRNQDEEQHTETSASITAGEMTQPTESASAHLLRTMAIAELAEIMRASFWAQCADPGPPAATAQVSIEQDTTLASAAALVLQTLENHPDRLRCQR